jgi:hypothetical protein
LLPRLPAAKPRAILVGVQSDFIEARRCGLVRWLTIVTTHPIIAEDLMVKFFLTDTLTDHATSLRDQFRLFPDEFILSELGPRARELATPGLRSSVTGAQAQLAGLEEVVKRVAVATGRLVGRSAEEGRDMAEFGRDLGTIGSSASVFGDTDFFFEASKEVARVAARTAELAKRQEGEVHQKVRRRGRRWDRCPGPPAPGRALGAHRALPQDGEGPDQGPQDRWVVGFD